jgi:hypothetical protein
MPRGLRIALLMAAAGFIALAVVAALPSNRWFWLKAFAKGPHTITYQVTGNGESATVTYTTPQGQTARQDVVIPWETSFDVASGTPVEMRAVSGGDGSITCRIKWEGHTIWVATNYGGHPPTCEAHATA